MKLLKIERKDVYVALEFSAKELNFLKSLFDHADIVYDGEEDPEMKKADMYLQEKFYPFLKYFIEEGQYEIG